MEINRGAGYCGSHTSDHSVLNNINRDNTILKVVILENLRRWGGRHEKEDSVSDWQVKVDCKWVHGQILCVRVCARTRVYKRIRQRCVHVKEKRVKGIHCLPGTYVMGRSGIRDFYSFNLCGCFLYSPKRFIQICWHSMLQRWCLLSVFSYSIPAKKNNINPTETSQKLYCFH